MEFLDSQNIRVRSGDGGPGMVSFRSAKNMPKLGADGGDGGHGGNVFLMGDARLNTLSRLYHRKLYAAESGQKGGTNGCTGRCGEDLIIEVPLGTIATNLDTNRKIAEVLIDRELYLIAQGGRRGLGNMRFLSATHQAPDEYSKGTKGEAFELGLELRLIADVGFAGLPNAGKSTLLSCISNARPKIADYPFTTLVPNLGVVDIEAVTGVFGASFVAADIPGLVEGASDGRGLGHAFLKHLERTKVICYMIDPFNLEGVLPIDNFRLLRNELQQYSEKLFKKPGIVVLTKSDNWSHESSAHQGIAALRAEARKLGFKILTISAATSAGLDQLKRELFVLVEEYRPQVAVSEAESDEGRRLSEAIPGFEFIVKSEVNRRLGLS